MTIAELKRHMDRRFNRLERVKADKLDLRRFASKKDLRRFATKSEMRFWALESRRHFDVVAEGLEEKPDRVADGVAAESAAIKLHLAHYGKVLDDHEAHITAIERHP